jgi:hypothetical protein
VGGRSVASQAYVVCTGTDTHNTAVDGSVTTIRSIATISRNQDLSIYNLNAGSKSWELQFLTAKLMARDAEESGARTSRNTREDFRVQATVRAISEAPEI